MGLFKTDPPGLNICGGGHPMCCGWSSVASSFHHVNGRRLIRLGACLSGEGYSSKGGGGWGERGAGDGGKKRKDTFFFIHTPFNKSAVYQGPSRQTILFRPTWQHRPIIIAPILRRCISQVSDNSLLIVWTTPEQLLALFWWQGSILMSDPQ